MVCGDKKRVTSGRHVFWKIILIRTRGSLNDERCVGANSSDAQEPFDFDFKYWIGFCQRENNEENHSNIEVATLISKLQTRCIIAHDST